MIVRASQGVGAAEEAQLTALGADIYRHLPLVRSVALRLPARKLKTLRALPFVERLSSDLTVKKADEFTVNSTQAIWGNQAIWGTNSTAVDLSSTAIFGES